MKKLPVSAFIIAKNEADRIAAAIQSVRDWCDEVLVIDSGSTDGTVQRSQELGAQTHYREWTGYGPQKVYGESLCRHPWVFNIDADEEVSPELRDEIIALFEHREPPHAAYRLQRTETYNFHDRPHPWASTTDWIRLYRKDSAGFKDSPVHDTVVVHRGKTGRLRGRFWHRSFRSFHHHLDKVNAYSSAQAEDRFRKGREPSWLTLLLTPPLSFLKSFFLRREFVNGVDGVVVSFMYAFQRFIRLAKTRERFQLERKKPRL